MGAGDISLAIMITAQNQASSVIQGLARDLGPLGVGMAAVGVGAVAAGVAAVKMAGDYRSTTTTLVTGAGESVKNLGMVRQGLLGISVATGTSTDALVKSMFLVESAGYHGAAGLQVETIAAEGAKVAHADLTQTADILTTSLHDFNLTAGQSTPVMNSLIVTVQNGKMTMDNLNESMKTVLPVAGALHVPLADVEGALSTMAIAGDKGSIAGTHLAMMLKMLANPASTAQKEMSAMGIDSIKLAQTMQTSLPAALQMIQNAVAQHFVPGSVEYNRAIATILGGSKSGIAGLELMGQNMNTLVTDTNAAANAFKNSGKDVQGWAMVQGDFNQKLDQLHATLNVVLIDLGTKMLPVLTDIVQNGLIPFVNNLDYIVKNGSPIITFLQGSSVGATLLKDAMIGLALAIAAVKIATIVNAMGDFVAAVPGMLAKIYLVQTSMTGIGTASTSAATATATSAAAMELSLAGIVTGIGLVLVAEIGLAKWIRDNNIVPKAGTNQPDWVTHLNSTKTSADNAAKAAKDLDAQIQQAWKDEQGLYDWAHSHNHILGDLQDPLTLQPTDVKIMTIKSHLDDLAKPWVLPTDLPNRNLTALDLKVIDLKSHIDDLQGPVSIGVLTPDVEIARAKVIDLKSHMDDLTGPVNVGVLTPDVVAARMAAIDAKSHLDDLKGPTTPIVLTPQITSANVLAMETKTHLDDLVGPTDILTGYPDLTSANVLAMETKTHLDDLIGPTNIGVNYGSLTQANVNAMVLKSHLDDISNNPVNVNVNTNYSSSGTPPPLNIPIRRFASGVENFSGGMAFVHQGEVLMNLSRGTNVIPANKVSTGKGAFGLSSARGGNDKTMNITVQLDSRNMMQALGVRMGKEVRIQGNYRNG